MPKYDCREAEDDFGQPKETFPRGPSNEQTLLTELGSVKRALEKTAWNERELEGSLAMARQHITLLQIERDKLLTFKDWVHAYLNVHDVPDHPPGTHGAEGCRIGDRMDWLMAKLANAEQAVDHIAAEVKAESEEIYRHLEQCRIDRDDWKARCEATEKDAKENWDGWQESMAGHKECLALCVRQAEQIRRLREALEWALSQTHIYASANPGHDAARAILKETAPNA